MFTKLNGAGRHQAWRRALTLRATLGYHRAAMRLSPLNLLFISLFITLASSAAWAQPIPIFSVGDQGAAGAAGEQAQRDLEAIARVAGANALVGPALSAQIEERYATRDEWTDTMQAVRTRITRSKRAYNEAIANNQRPVAEALLRSLEEDADALLAQPLGLDRLRENREALMGALLFIADVCITEQPARATEALRKLATAFPELTLGARAASAQVRTAFREQVAQIATASLVVQSVPDACQVQHNGALLGSAPVQLQRLAAGQHRLSIRCGGRRSLVHRVTAGASATSSVQIDIELDRAVAFGDQPGLRYNSERAANERMVNDASVIASALGAERVVLYRERTRRVFVVDVVARSVLRELSESEFAQLAQALRGTATAPVNTAEPRPAPQVVVRPAMRATPSRPPHAVAAHTQPAPSGLTIVLGSVFTATGVLLAAGGTGAWLGADYVRAQSLRVGQDGLPFGGVSNSLSSAETPVRVLAVGGWIAGAGLAATGIAMIAVGTGRREPSQVSVSMTGHGVSVQGAF